jgi:hypothetical protein
VTIIIAYLVQGVFTAPALLLSALLLPIYIIGIAIGARLFRGASEHTYRRAAYAIIALSALVSVPLLDRILR